MSDPTDPTDDEYTLSADDRAAAEDAVNDHIRAVMRGAGPYIGVPYTTADGQRATLKLYGPTVGAETADTAARILGRHADPAAPTVLPTAAPVSDPAPVPRPSAAERAHVIAHHIADAVRGGTDPAALTVRGVADATGVPHATVGRSRPWQAFCAWRESARVGQIRTVTLTAEMLAVVADKGAADPAATAEARETLADLIEAQRREMDAENR